ncbi:MAG: hypothetical protein KGQ26_05250 [Rhodospirillales bacterium]|nr:hypothetical protein [Rhodospirillales bacterium]MDE2318747.1 hypothetical protein [Rhodospirillales bacterium]
MKISLWLSCLLALVPACGFAQVTVNPAALRQLEGLPPATAVAGAKPAMVRPVIHKPHTHHYHRAKPEAPETGAPPPPAKPAPSPKPQPAPAPKPVALPVASIEFSPGSATLPAGAASTLKPFCAAKAPVQVVARAPADPNDPSGAMRLSLNRAFVIRDALAACGVPSQNIIPRAAGSVPGADDNQALIGASAAP